MTDFPILRDLGFVVVGSAALLLATRRAGLPPILAYILVGLLLGPIAGLLTVSESLEVFSEIGIALLLFLVGLEMSVAKIRDVGRPALLGGVTQVAIAFLAGGGIALALGFPAPTAALLGLTVAFSSTVVVVKLLDRSGELGERHGRLSIGILLVQDVLVAVALTLVSGLGTGAGEASSVWTGLGQAFLGIVVLVAAAAAAVRWALPRILGWLAESGEGLFIVSLTWCFAFIMAAEAFHVSIELGAFVAGIAIAQLPYQDELRRRVHPLVNFFLAVFFVSLGAGMELRPPPGTWAAVAALGAFVIVGKPVLTALILGGLRQPGRTSVLTGVTLGQISEFSFVLLALAAGAGLVGAEIVSLVGLLGLVTFGASALLVPRGRPLADWLERRSLLGAFGGRDRTAAAPAPASGHIVVVGMNGLGRRIVHAFAERGERVVAVDTDPDKLGGLPAEGVFGNIDNRGVLEEAGVERARLVVSALQIESVNNLLAYRCRELGVPVSIHAFDPGAADDLLQIGVDHLMMSKLDGVRPMEAELASRGVLG